MKRLIPARLLAALGEDGSARLELPADVLHESRRRVRVAALLGTFAYSVFLAVELTRIGAAAGPRFAVDMRHDVLGVLLCGALFATTLIRAAGDRLVLSFALAAELLLSVLISTHAPWAAFLRTGSTGGLTWVVPIVILFALLVPLPTRTTMVASSLCLLTMPLGLLALSAAGLVRVPAASYWVSSLNAVVGLAIATLAARTVYGAGVQAIAARRVGSYELIERLGQGGMGEVWKARHLLLARPAAVKLILAENLRGPREERETAIDRFTREARVTASLRSPHTVGLFDFGAGADGTLYYAMELLDGMNLEHFIYRFGPVEPRRAVHWLRQACHSLAEAHARGLIHRDIKPANIYLCRYGRDTDFIKLLDFGLTKPLGPAPDLKLTQPGQRLGTPAYMAPEQIFGLESAPATDLYALGCVGYWLLAGRKPFEGESAGELLRQHAQTAPPALATLAPQPVPPRLETLIMACLSKSPAARPLDAEALSEALGASLDNESWTTNEARAWWEKNLGEARAEGD